MCFKISIILSMIFIGSLASISSLHLKRHNHKTTLDSLLHRLGVNIVPSENLPVELTPVVITSVSRKSNDDLTDNGKNDEQSDAGHGQLSMQNSVKFSQRINELERRKQDRARQTIHMSVKNDDITKALYEINQAVQCKIPQLKIIRVADVHKSPPKSYLTACVKLHVCSEDSGCCPVNQKCGPKMMQIVQLPVIAMHFNYKTKQNMANIEYMEFRNHTECSCLSRDDEMPRDTSRKPDEELKKKCKCPIPYTIRYLADGSCTCDCFDKQRDCTKYKRGKAYFSYIDRLCIESGDCTIPTCDYGNYIKRNGRCPSKHKENWTFPRYYYTKE